MSKQDYIDNLKEQLKNLNVFKSVKNQRTGTIPNAYPAATLYIANVSNSTDDMEWNTHEKSLKMMIDVWLQVSNDPEKSEADMVRFDELLEDNLVSPTDAPMRLINTEYLINDEKFNVLLVSQEYEIKYFKEHAMTL